VGEVKSDDSPRHDPACPSRGTEAGMRAEANTANYGSDPRREPASPPRGTRAGEREGMTVANERNKRKGVSDVGWQGTNDVSNEWALPAKRNRENPVVGTGPVSGSIQGMTDQADEQHVASIAAPPTPPLHTRLPT